MTQVDGIDDHDAVRSAADVTVVVMTRNRRGELLDTLARLTALPGSPPVVVADNGSRDGTVAAVRDAFPEVRVLPLGHNAGVTARNEAVRLADTPYIAFSDDDSWWAPGALDRVAAVLDRHPRIALVTAHVLVEPGGRDDPVSIEMQHSPVSGDPSLPGIPVLGFLACAAAVRRDAFLAVGGFPERLHFSGEEELLAIDLAAAGWELRYMPDIVVHHSPSSSRDTDWRLRRGVRNALWTLWLRRPAAHAVRRSWQLLRSTRPAVAVTALGQALGGLSWVLRERRVVPDAVERDLRRLEPQQDESEARQYRS